MPFRYALLLAPLALPLALHAQTPGTCTLGTATGALDVSDVHATLFNTGSLFFGNGEEAAYLVPKLTARSPIYAAGLWVGGYVGGELRVAGATYADFEFWPGPLLPGGELPNLADCSAYDRIWRVSRGDVERYYATGVASPDLAEWPYDLGAPVLDGDGDPTNYDLAGGDQPAISGDQTLWWVMNDVGNVHRNTLVPPIGLEVRVEAFAFGGGPAALRQATFYRYTLVNRNVQPLTEALFGLFADVDLGDAGDDYVGVDTARGLGFVYNADNQDGNGTPPSYGTPPPAAGFDLLSDQLGAFHAILDSVWPRIDPNNGQEIYYTMQGRWLDGMPMQLGGTGYQQGSAPVTTFAYPGDPVTGGFWSMRCPGTPKCGAAVSPQDQRLAFASRSFTLAPGEACSFVVAIVFAQGTSNLDSIAELRRASTVAQNAHDAGYLDAVRVPGFVPAPLPGAIVVRRPAPNPFEGRAVIRYSLPAAARVRVAVLDVLGREVAVLADGPAEAGPHEAAVEGAPLAPGVYVARVWVNGEAVAALPLTRR